MLLIIRTISFVLSYGLSVTMHLSDVVSGTYIAHDAVQIEGLEASSDYIQPIVDPIQLQPTKTWLGSLLMYGSNWNRLRSIGNDNGTMEAIVKDITVPPDQESKQDLSRIPMQNTSGGNMNTLNRNAEDPPDVLETLLRARGEKEIGVRLSTMRHMMRGHTQEPDTTEKPSVEPSAASIALALASALQGLILANQTPLPKIDVDPMASQRKAIEEAVSAGIKDGLEIALSSVENKYEKERRSSSRERRGRDKHDGERVADRSQSIAHPVHLSDDGLLRTHRRYDKTIDRRHGDIVPESVHEDVFSTVIEEDIMKSRSALAQLRTDEEDSLDTSSSVDPHDYMIVRRKDLLATEPSKDRQSKRSPYASDEDARSYQSRFIDGQVPPKWRTESGTSREQTTRVRDRKSTAKDSYNETNKSNYTQKRSSPATFRSVTSQRFPQPLVSHIMNNKATVDALDMSFSLSDVDNEVGHEFSSIHKPARWNSMKYHSGIGTSDRDMGTHASDGIIEDDDSITARELDMMSEDAVQERTVGYMNTIIRPRDTQKGYDVSNDEPLLFAKPVPRNKSLHHPIVTQPHLDRPLLGPMNSDTEPSLTSKSSAKSKSSSYSSVRSRYTSEGSDSYHDRLRMRKAHSYVEEESLISSDLSTALSRESSENIQEESNDLSDTLSTENNEMKNINNDKQKSNIRVSHREDVISSSAESDFSLSALNNGGGDFVMGKVPLRLWRPSNLPQELRHEDKVENSFNSS